MSGLALLGLIMLLVMLGAIFIGFPISFTLLFLALTFGYFGLGEVVFSLAYFQTIGMMKEELLAAVPLFIFMGFITEQAGLMERLFTAFRLLLAPIRGSLYAVVILTSAVFAMATGIVGAAVTVLGIMASPIMIKTGYDGRLSAGAITAGGTLGILIPPSIMLVVMGPVLEVPVTTLFAAAIVPGILLATLFTGYAMLRCLINPKLGPPLAVERRAVGAAALWIEFFAGLVPPAVLVLAALGSIVFGIATPTEGAACGAAGALLLTLAYRRLTWARLKDALVKTLEISVLILFLVATSNFFGAVFARLGTPTMLTDVLLGLDLNRYVVLSFIMGLIFLLGWPLEWVPIVLIVVPFLLPLVTKLGFDLTWFGILVAVNLQTAWLSPPVALSAYFLKGVVPQWDLGDIYKGMMQFMGLQLFALVLIIAFPEIALWLPKLIYSK